MMECEGAEALTAAALPDESSHMQQSSLQHSPRTRMRLQKQEEHDRALALALADGDRTPSPQRRHSSPRRNHTEVLPDESSDMQASVPHSPRTRIRLQKEAALAANRDRTPSPRRRRSPPTRDRTRAMTAVWETFSGRRGPAVAPRPPSENPPARRRYRNIDEIRRRVERLVPSRQIDPNNYEELLMALEQSDDEGDYHPDEAPRGLSKYEVDRLPKSRYHPKDADDDEEEEREVEDEECDICMEAFQPGVLLRTLPCRHHFHVACIDLWIKDHATCPVCRARIKC